MVLARQGVLPIKTLISNKRHTCCHNLLLEELSESRVIPLGEDFWKLAPFSLQTLPHVPFPLLTSLCILLLD